MAMLPKLKLKAIVSFPANVYGGTGIGITKANGNFTINLDYSEFPTTGTLPPNTNALVWDPVTDTYYLVPPSSVGGISDAPSDSKMYGRINRAWVDAWASPILTGNPTAPTPTAGDNDTSIATTAFVASAVSTVTITGGVTYTPQSPTVSQQTIARQNIYAAPFDALAYNGMQINGSMEVSQERGVGGGISLSGANAGAYVVDGWKGSLNLSSGAINYGQLTPAVPGIPYALQMAPTTPQATLSSTDYVRFVTLIEGCRFSRTAWGTAQASPVTVGFYVRANLSGTYRAIITNFDGSSVTAWMPFAIVGGAAFQYVTITFAAQTAGTWKTDNLTGASLIIEMASTATPNTIASGGYATITGVVVLPGIEAPSAARSALIMRPYDQELLTCSRYYYKRTANIFGYNAGGQTVATWFPHPVPMRSIPTISATGGTATNATGLTADAATLYGFRNYMTVTATGLGQIDSYTQIADIRL